MLYLTHRNGGFLAATVGYSLLMSQGMLPESNLTPILQFAIVIPVAGWASTMPDLDHNWDSVRDHSPVNWVIHKLLHFGLDTRKHAKHRSIQTHWLGYIGIIFLFLFCFLKYPVTLSFMSNIDIVITRLILTGFMLGVLSHLLLDLISTAGLPVLLKKDPSKSSGYRVIRFSLVGGIKACGTGTNWERNVNRVLIIVLIGFTMYNLYYMIDPQGIYLTTVLDWVKGLIK